MDYSLLAVTHQRGDPVLAREFAEPHIDDVVASESFAHDLMVRRR